MTKDFRIALDADKDDCLCRSGPYKRCLTLCLVAYFFLNWEPPMDFQAVPRILPSLI